MDLEPINLDIDAAAGVGAYYRARVMQVLERATDGTILKACPASEWTEPVHNLILPAGLQENLNWGPGQMTRFQAGSGTTPNSALLDGTFQQVGTTVTRVSGTGVFISGNVNDFVKFATGEKAKITGFTNSTTVTVDRSQAVAAAALTVYDTSRTQLDTYVAETTSDDPTSGFSGFSNDTGAGTVRYWFTKNFAAETTAKTYTEVGFTNKGVGGSATLFSRALLDTPVNVDIDQFLQLRSDLIVTMGNCRVQSALTLGVTGWPYPYTITDITSNGTYWEVTTSVNHHFANGRPVTISGSLPTTVAISSITSTVSTITVNTSVAHGKSNGDSVVIAGSTPSGYNATWTIANVVDADTFEITSAINLGAGSGGTVRLATPGTWYDGTHTISAVPAANKFRITNANVVTGANSGTVVNNLNVTAIVTGYAFSQTIVSTTGNSPFDISNTGQPIYLFSEANIKTGLQYGVTTNINTPISGGATMTRGTYDASNRSRPYAFVLASSAGNDTAIRQISIGGPNGIWLTFDERQRKDNGYQLSMTYTLSWEPDLA